MIRLLLAASVLAAPAAAQAQAQAQAQRLPPVDRCAPVPGFAAFRARLNAAIARRDAAFILANVSDDVVYTYPDDGGRAGFARFWRLDRPAASPLWATLAAALRLGCARDSRGQLWAPSMNLPDEEAPDDASYAGQAVAFPGATVRVAPSDTARPIARLQWDLLSLPDADDGRSAWAHVWFGDNRDGFVRRSRIRALTDYRAVFEKRGGRWRLVSFVEGD